MEITHYNGTNYLILIDCSPIQFTIWQQLYWQELTSIIDHLKAVQGPPAELFTDDNTAFHNKLLKIFWDE